MANSFGTSGSGINLSHPRTDSQASRSADNFSAFLTKARAQQVVNVGSGPLMLRVETVFLYLPCESCAVGSSSSVGAPNVRWRLVGRPREEDMVVRDKPPPIKWPDNNENTVRFAVTGPMSRDGLGGGHTQTSSVISVHKALRIRDPSWFTRLLCSIASAYLWGSALCVEVRFGLDLSPPPSCHI